MYDTFFLQLQNALGTFFVFLLHQELRAEDFEPTTQREESYTNPPKVELCKSSRYCITNIHNTLDKH